MDVAVIGAGAAATCLIDALSRQESEPGRLTVFDPSPQPWRGRPYAQDLDQVRVNLPPQQMSARHGDDTHFADWLRAGPHGAERHLDPRLNQPLPPRAVYGEYLEQTAEAALAVLRGRGWEVELIARRVTGAGASAGDRVVLHTADGEQHVADRAVLCVGAGSPRDVHGLAGAPGFVLDPYPLADALENVAADANVAVIGSGLTAVDVVVCLAARGHRGRITLLSRSGLLPYVQQRGFPFQPKHLSRGRLLELADQHGGLTLRLLEPLFNAELGEFGEEPDRLAAEIGSAATEHPAERLRRQLDDVDSGERARRVLLRLIRALGPTALGLFSEADRKELQETHYRVVSSLCSPMVPVNAAVLLALHDAGQLELVEGLQRIEPVADGGFDIRTGRGRLRAEVVVNAVNASPYATPDCAEGLLHSLVEAGSAELRGTGGLNTEPGTGRLVVDGRPDPRFLALGDIAGTNLFITSSMAGLVIQTPAVAGALLSSDPA
jgi:hypothetical protein